jgi:hypothetical protein
MLNTKNCNSELIERIKIELLVKDFLAIFFLNK